MIAKTLSGAVTGIEAEIIEVQCDVSKGLPNFKIVGLPEKEVQESRERIRSAIQNSGFSFPTKKITANLAPADVKKEGVGLDLPIGCAILSATDQLDSEKLRNKLLIGELSLDGEVSSVRGVLPVVLAAKEDPEIDSILVPEGNVKEASIVEALDVYPITNLREAVYYLNNEIPKDPFQFDRTNYMERHGSYELDFKDIKGQQGAKRVLEIAAAGSHNVLMCGPPGAGKSMLAKRLPTILPYLSFEESLEVTKIYSIVGELGEDTPIITRRKVRTPHHTTSYAGMVGGGHGNPRPGEISLAHRGVLFLDELPEFNRRVLETLRQPLEDQNITISRASISVKFPADFTLIAAMNPCPCGYLGDPVKECTCRPHEIRRYRKKISGPFLDRMDMFVEVQRLEKTELMSRERGEDSANVRKRVSRAREIQEERFDEDCLCNGQMRTDRIKEHCELSDNCRNLLGEAVDRFGFSARSYHKILKVSRTIADLSDSDKINPEHISEAIQHHSSREKLLQGAEY